MRIDNVVVKLFQTNTTCSIHFVSALKTVIWSEKRIPSASSKERKKMILWKQKEPEQNKKIQNTVRSSKKFTYMYGVQSIRQQWSFRFLFPLFSYSRQRACSHIWCSLFILLESMLVFFWLAIFTVAAFTVSFFSPAWLEV